MQKEKKQGQQRAVNQEVEAVGKLTYAAGGCSSAIILPPSKFSGCLQHEW